MCLCPSSLHPFLGHELCGNRELVCAVDQWISDASHSGHHVINAQWKTVK